MPPLSSSEEAEATTATTTMMGGKGEVAVSSSRPRRVGRSISSNNNRSRSNARSTSPMAKAASTGSSSSGRRPTMNRSRSSSNLPMGGSSGGGGLGNSQRGRNDARVEARHARATLSRSRSFKRQISANGLPGLNNNNNSRSMLSLTRGQSGGGNSSRSVSDPQTASSTNNNYQWSPRPPQRQQTTATATTIPAASTTASVSNRMRRRSRSPMKTIQMKSPARPESVQNFMRRYSGDHHNNNQQAQSQQQTQQQSRLRSHQRDPFATLLTEDSLGNSTATPEPMGNGSTWSAYAGAMGRKLGTRLRGGGEDKRDDVSGHSEDDSDDNISIKMTEFIGSSAINHTGGGAISPLASPVAPRRSLNHSPGRPALSNSPNHSPGRPGLSGGRRGSRRNLLAATKGSSMPTPTMMTMGDSSMDDSLLDDSLLSNSGVVESGGGSAVMGGSRRNLLATMNSSFKGGNLSFRGKIHLSDDDDDVGISLDLGDHCNIASRRDNFNMFLAARGDGSNKKNSRTNLNALCTTDSAADLKGVALPDDRLSMVQLKLDPSQHGGRALLVDDSQHQRHHLLMKELPEFSFKTFENNVHYIQENAPELNCFSDIYIKNLTYLRKEYATPFCQARSNLFSKNLSFLKEKIGFV